MSRKKHSFLAVPPKDKRIRYFRIRFAIVIFIAIIMVGGIIGFFIPFNSLTLDVKELNQKKHLTDQNKKLLGKIRNMREDFFTLRSKVDTLRQTKEQMAALIDLDSHLLVSDTVLTEYLKSLSLDEILERVNKTESFFDDFVEKVKKHPAYLDYVPVAKPVIEDNVITARFGERKDPFTGDMKWHNGVDFSAERETRVVATASGTVERVDNHKYWGLLIQIRHRFGFSTTYAHLGTVNVKRGNKVKKGEIIATIGISGLATGPHLHYEISHNKNTIDPELYFFPDSMILASR